MLGRVLSWKEDVVRTKNYHQCPVQSNDRSISEQIGSCPGDPISYVTIAHECM